MWDTWHSARPSTEFTEGWFCLPLSLSWPFLPYSVLGLTFNVHPVPIVIKWQSTCPTKRSLRKFPFKSLTREIAVSAEKGIFLKGERCVQVVNQTLSHHHVGTIELVWLFHPRSSEEASPVLCESQATAHVRQLVPAHGRRHVIRGTTAGQHGFMKSLKPCHRGAVGGWSSWSFQKQWWVLLPWHGKIKSD